MAFPAVLRSFRENPEARRLALIFAVVYFAQGMWYLPNLSLTFLLKETLHLSAGQTADFFAITIIPWLIKPVYGLVLTDAMMVENGQRLALTGPFQAVQWAAISVASIVVGMAGGRLAEHAPLSLTFLISAIFPMLSFGMGIWAVREAPVQAGERQFRATWQAIRGAIGSRHLWIVAGFIFFYNFSPSFGPALVYYATDTLHFSKTFVGDLESLAYASGLGGAALYFTFSKTVPLRRLLHFAIAAGVLSTLAYFGYVNHAAAVAIALVFGGVGMIIQLTFLDLAAKACPKQAEGTFFALLMSIYNGAMQLSQNVGGRLYDLVGFNTLILISAGFTALCWFLLPFVRVEEIEARAREQAAGPPAPAGA